ncbi:MAG: MFS transporter [Oscillospiraceae bacterium]|nr:MFS transporter [Oscillospiraceae bacterium]
MSRNPIRMVRDAAVSIKGNARSCVFMEPLFTIPHTMYTSYMTLYMLELGLNKSQVGMITSLGLAAHIFFALISAYITDKLGRRYTTLIFDTIGWVGSQLIWALAQNIYFFAAASIVNAFGRIVMNSWHCLMLEDSKPAIRVHVFNFLQIAGILAGFFAPFGALLINRMTLIPAMRAMLLFSIVSMIALFYIRHNFVTETEMGKQKMEEMKGVSMWGVFKAYVPAIRRILKERLLVIALLLRSLNFIQLTIRNTFLAVLVTERLGFPTETMAVFHVFGAIVTLVTLTLITPYLSQITRRWPISLGIFFHIGATAVLLLSPPAQNYPLLVLSAILIALGTGIAAPRIDALVANTIANEDRSIVNAIVSVIILLLSTPFGYIGGILSDIDPRLPFLLTLSVFLVCLMLLRVAASYEKQRDTAAVV